MQNILIIGAGDFQLPLVQRASQSYNVLLAAPVISDAFKPYITDSLLIDVRDEEAILAYAREHSICGVITDQTDIAVRSVAYVAENLGLPGIGSETGRLFTDKSLMRDRMAQLGIKLLPHRTVSSEKEGLQFYREIGGDIIIKPLDTQGSRGVLTTNFKTHVSAILSILTFPTLLLPKAAFSPQRQTTNSVSAFST